MMGPVVCLCSPESVAYSYVLPSCTDKVYAVAPRQESVGLLSRETLISGNKYPGVLQCLCMGGNSIVQISKGKKTSL